MPFEATTSMHTDLTNKKQTEIGSLTEYVIKQGKSYNVPTPTYNLMLTKLHSLIS